MTRISKPQKIFALSFAVVAFAGLTLSEADAGRRHHNYNHQHQGQNNAAALGIAALVGGVLIGSALSQNGRGNVQYYNQNHYGYDYSPNMYEEVTVYRPVTRYKPVRVYRPVRQHHYQEQFYNGW